MRSPVKRRLAYTITTFLFVVSLVGFIVSMMANSFVFTNYQAHGEVPIPAGVADPPVTESYGHTQTINNDAYRPVWVVQISQTGDYIIKTDGQVNGYIDPQLAFGHGSTMGWLPWPFAGLFGFVLVAYLYLNFTGRRARKRAIQAPHAPEGRYVPGSQLVSADESLKLHELKALSDLHASGALTDAEFEAEKRRILPGG